MHDKNGVELEVGDKVRMEFSVLELYPGADTCNVRLSRNIEGEQSVSLTCQTKQVEKVADPQ